MNARAVPSPRRILRDRGAFPYALVPMRPLIGTNQT